MQAITKALIVATALVVTPAHADWVLVAGSGSPLQSLSKDEAGKLYSGKGLDVGAIGRVSPIDLPEESPVRQAFYQEVTGRTPVQVKAYFAKLVFTGVGTPPRQVPSDAEVKKLVSQNTNMVGYIDKGSVDGSVRVILR